MPKLKRNSAGIFKSKLTTSKIGSLIIAPIVIGAATQYLRAVLNNEADIQIAAVLVVLLLAWAALQIMAAEKEAEKQEAAEEHVEALARDVSDLRSYLQLGDGVSYVGTSNSPQVLAAIRAKLRGARSVRNSLVGVPGTKEYAEAVRGVYDGFFTENDRSAEWLDMASFAEIFGDRFKLHLPKEVVDRRHKVKVLKHSTPLVNCTIITQGDRHIAFFGWTYTAAVADAPVFYTEDDRIVAMFRDYFDFLWSAKTTRGEGWVDYEGGTGRVRDIDVVDKTGRWITMATSVQSGKENVESYAVLEIDFDPTLKIKGKIYNPDLTPKGDIDSRNETATTNRIYFDYPVGRLESVPSGHCQYRFVKSGDDDLLEGYFVNDQSRVWKGVVGFKVNESVGDDVALLKVKVEQLKELGKVR